MATESEPEQEPTEKEASSAPAAPRKKKKKGAKPAKISRPLTEAEINVPDLQTTVSLGVLCATAITLWIFAHVGCNYHPPRETRRPRQVTTAELTREPKDAAIEFQHRLLTSDFKGALEIAAGPLVEKVKADQAACGANKGSCEAKRKAAANAISSAVVLERNALVSKVRVTTSRLPAEQSFLVMVERDLGTWKATGMVPATDGATLPPPTLVTKGQPGMRLEAAPAPEPAPSAAPPAAVSAAPVGRPPAGLAVPAAPAPKAPAPAAPVAPAPSARP